MKNNDKKSGSNDSLFNSRIAGINLMEDKILIDEITSESGNPDSTTSKFVTELALGVYDQMENIIQKFGNDVGLKVTPILVDLLEKLDIYYKTYENLSNQNLMHKSEIEHLKKSIDHHKLYRLNTETSMFQLEEEVINLRSHVDDYKNQISFLERKVTTLNDKIEVKGDARSSGHKGMSRSSRAVQNSGRNRKFSSKKRGSSVGETDLVTSMDSSVFDKSNNKKRYHSIKKKRTEKLNNSNSIFYSMVENKYEWDNLIDKVCKNYNNPAPPPIVNDKNDAGIDSPEDFNTSLRAEIENTIAAKKYNESSKMKENCDVLKNAEIKNTYKKTKPTKSKTIEQDNVSGNNSGECDNELFKNTLSNKSLNVKSNSQDDYNLNIFEKSPELKVSLETASESPGKAPDNLSCDNSKTMTEQINDAGTFYIERDGTMSTETVNSENNKNYELCTNDKILKLVNLVKRFKAKNELLVKKFELYDEERMVTHSKLKYLHDDLLKVKSYAKSLNLKKEKYTNHIQYLQEQLSGYIHQNTELSKENSKLNKYLESVGKKCFLWKNACTRYKNSFESLNRCVDWHEKFNSCENYSSLEKEKVPIKSLIYRAFSKLFGSKNLKPKFDKTSIHTNDLIKSESESISSLDILRKSHVIMSRKNEDTALNGSNRNSATKTYDLNEKNYMIFENTQISLNGRPLYTREVLTGHDMEISTSAVVELITGSKIKEVTYPLTFWLCFSGKSNSIVQIFDGSNFSNIINSFSIEHDRVLCMHCMPGFSPDHYYDSTVKFENNEELTKKIRDYTYITNRVEFVSAYCVKPDSPKYPTVWIGTLSGKLEIHPTSGDYDRVIASIDLPGPVISITHQSGQASVLLSNNSILLYKRNKKSYNWNFSVCRVITLNTTAPLMRCLCSVLSPCVYVGAENQIFVMNTLNATFESSFVSNENESYIRNICSSEKIVSVTYKDSTIMDIFECIGNSKIVTVDFNSWLMSNFITDFPCFRITSSTLKQNNLLIGTNIGVIFKISLLSLLHSDCEESVKVLSRSHNYSVRFILSYTMNDLDTVIIITGGRGYSDIYFDDDTLNYKSGMNSSYNHIFIWSDL